LAVNQARGEAWRQAVDSVEDDELFAIALDQAGRLGVTHNSSGDCIAGERCARRRAWSFTRRSDQTIRPVTASSILATTSLPLDGRIPLIDFRLRNELLVARRRMRPSNGKLVVAKIDEAVTGESFDPSAA